MKHLFFKLNQINEYEDMLKFSPKSKGDLNLLYMSLNPTNDWIKTLSKDDTVYIWINFDEEEYETWEEIPKLELTKSNYQSLISQIIKNKNKPAPYVIFSQDNSGKFYFTTKQKLSPEEIKILEHDKLEAEKQG